MFRFLRPQCSCHGRIRKLEFYLDPYKRWDFYYCCDTCGAHGATVDLCQAAGKAGPAAAKPLVDLLSPLSPLRH